MNLKKATQYTLLVGGMVMGMNTHSQNLDDDLKKYRENIDSLLNQKYFGTKYSYTEHTEKNNERGTIIYKHQDATTTQVLDALSGFDSNMKLYLDTIAGGDSLMYKTIRKMHTKYKNPKMEQVEKFEKATTKADYNIYSNIIRIYENRIINEGYYQFDQKFYLESWIAELSHAYLIERDGLEPHAERCLEEYRMLEKQGKTYNDLYKMVGSTEYEAHQIIEKQLKKEFIDIYVSLSDTNNTDHLYKILRLYVDIFDEYMDREDADIMYYEKIKKIDGEIKDREVVSKLALKCQTRREESRDEKYFELAKKYYLDCVKIDGRGYKEISNLYRRKGDIENAIKYYELYYSDASAWHMVALGFIGDNKYAEAIQIYEDKAKNGDTYAMFQLIRLYNPDNSEIDYSIDLRKKCPYKDQKKKEYWEREYKKTRNIFVRMTKSIFGNKC